MRFEVCRVLCVVCAALLFLAWGCADNDSRPLPPLEWDESSSSSESSASDGGEFDAMGGLGDACYPNATCDVGLECVDDLCRSEGASEGELGGPCGPEGACEADLECRDALCRQLRTSDTGPSSAGGSGGGPTSPTEPPDTWPSDTWPLESGTARIWLHSEEGDYIGLGRTYEYTQANADITAFPGRNKFNISVNPDDGGSWNGTFAVPDSLEELTPGSYSGLSRYPFHEHEVGGLRWGGMGRGCNTLTGSFDIESVMYNDDELLAIHIRFRQHCEGMDPVLRGSVYWAK